MICASCSFLSCAELHELHELYELCGLTVVTQSGVGMSEKANVCKWVVWTRFS